MCSWFPWNVKAKRGKCDMGAMYAATDSLKALLQPRDFKMAWCFMRRTYAILYQCTKITINCARKVYGALRLRVIFSHLHSFVKRKKKLHFLCIHKFCRWKSRTDLRLAHAGATKYAAEDYLSAAQSPCSCITIDCSCV